LQSGFEHFVILSSVGFRWMRAILRVPRSIAVELSNAVNVKVVLLDDAVGDTFGSVCKTSGVISSNASDSAPIYSRQLASALRVDDAPVNNEVLSVNTSIMGVESRWGVSLAA
jgi:hypothetical protein